MMWYMYIFCDHTCQNFLCGYTKDIKGTIASFAKMPTLFPDPKELKKLVYLEGFTSQASANERQGEVNRMNLQAKTDLVKAVNPKWVELVPGVNIEL